jgi:hypothetical protein
LSSIYFTEEADDEDEGKLSHLFIKLMELRWTFMDVSNITLNIVRSYGQACADLHNAIQCLRSKDYDLMVVPSRGASPFINGADSYGHALRNEKYETFDSGAPRLVDIEELYLPFTADSSDDFAISTKSIRRFWSRVLAALIRRDNSDLALRFYKLLQARSGDLATGSAPSRGGKSGKFIFVDTVISGQAISEIFDAFAEYDLNSCHFLLIIDYGGKRLNQLHQRKIEEMTQLGRATTIFVDRIFTEDQGPAMSGIWSVTIPELMVQAQTMIPEFENCIGAGLYYHEVAKRPDGSNIDITKSNAMLATLLYAAVCSADDVAERLLQRFIEHVGGRHLQDQAATKAIADPIILANLKKISATNVSSSHVLRAEMSKIDAEKIVKSFLDDVSK